MCSRLLICKVPPRRVIASPAESDYTTQSVGDLDSWRAERFSAKTPLQNKKGFTQPTLCWNDENRPSVRCRDKNLMVCVYIRELEVHKAEKHPWLFISSLQRISCFLPRCKQKALGHRLHESTPLRFNLTPSRGFQRAPWRHISSTAVHSLNKSTRVKCKHYLAQFSIFTHEGLVRAGEFRRELVDVQDVDGDGHSTGQNGAVWKGHRKQIQFITYLHEFQECLFPFHSTDIRWIS